MKFSAFFTTLALSIFATAIEVSYDTGYDNRGGSLANVACSDGTYGMLTRGFHTYGDLPTFPRIGASSAIAGYGSPSCGSCWQLTYTNPATGANKSINLLAIDHAAPGFNIAKEAMDELTGNQAEHLGRVNVTAKQVASSVCGL